MTDGRDPRQRAAHIQRDGTFSVVPQMKGGCTTAAQLRRIADVARETPGAAGQTDRRCSG
ncbi:hypothetical protein [Micromonospora sp. LOL_015]|uniref:hypothetical protein n=1 Tax=Micromonospora sp. LOL_015 TaxID=3345416 RepID=UPI003A88313B